MDYSVRSGRPRAVPYGIRSPTPSNGKPAAPNVPDHFLILHILFIPYLPRMRRLSK
jgi:hypothetical protein